MAFGQFAFPKGADSYGLPVEKVYLHFDRSTYKFGESCWFKAYVVSGPEFKLSNISRVLYVDWLDEHFNLIEQQKLKITDGQAEGNFLFSQNVPSGIFIARAYTRWMRNEDPAFFFKKLFNLNEDSSSLARRAANQIKDPINVAFFPEGGKMVEGIETRVAVRVSNENGEGVDVAGEIVDERGRQINQLATIYDGMAVFPYIPGQGKYSFKLSSGKAFELPVADKTGVVMNVNTGSRRNIFVSIGASTNNVNKEFTLIGLTANELCYKSKVILKKNRGEFLISKANLPSGVIQLALLDNAGSPICERMVFNNNIDKDYVQLRQNIRGDSVLFNLQTDFAKLNPADLAMSVSVGYDASRPKTIRNNNIFPYLLLSSESKTLVELPDELFGLQAAQDAFIVDLIMLTHDLRRSNLKPAGADTTKRINYQPEAALTLRGRVIDAYSKKTAKDGTIVLVIDNRDYKGIYTSEIDAHGDFKVENIDYGDSTLLVWQCRDKKGKIRPVEVELYDSIDIPPADTTLKLLVTRHLLQGKMNAEADTDTGSTDARYQMLEKVVVKGGEKKVRALGPGSILVIPDKDDLKLPASQFVSSYAIGLPFLKQVTTNDGSVMWLTTSNKPVRLFIDGIDVDEFGTGVNPYLYLLAYATEEIENVIISGSNHTGYTILVKINKNALRGPRNFVRQYARGYKTLRAFDPNQTLSPGNMFSGITTYWNPGLITNDKGTATFVSRTVAGKPVSVTLQGVGINGEIVDQTVLISPPL